MIRQLTVIALLLVVLATLILVGLGRLRMDVAQLVLLAVIATSILWRVWHAETKAQ